MLSTVCNILYDLGTRIYTLGIGLASWWHPKARLWVNGRKDLVNQLKSDTSIQPNGACRYWVHCASLGEFELAVPILEEIKRRENAFIHVTFYSPSGYELRKNYSLVNLVTYLPYDNQEEMDKFCDVVKPNIVLLIKYDFWRHMIRAVKDHGARLYVVGARFRPQMSYFTFLQPLYEPLFKQVDGWFTQDEASLSLLKSLGYGPIWCFGDTRVDRTLAIAATAFDHQRLEKWSRQKKTLVLGSIWPADLKVIAPALAGSRHEWQFIVAPHDVSEGTLTQVTSMLTGLKTVRYQVWTDSVDADIDVLLIDHIGSLSKLYRFGQVAYVGGAFGKGLHNILEPLAYHIPVLFGPRHQKFPEAKSAVEAGVGFVITQTDDFEKFMINWTATYWSDNEHRFHEFLAPSINSASRIVDILQASET